MKLSAPLRIAEIAAMLGWSKKKAKRFLRAMHVASGLRLLEGGVDRPYTVSLGALRRACPDLFEPPPGLEARMEETEERQSALEAQLLQTATVIGAMRRQGKPRAMLRAA